MPKYNSAARDDKHPIYVVITREKFPRIQMLRKNQLDPNLHDIYGPFQSTRIVRQLLTDLRRIIPYCTSKGDKGRACFYTNIHLCNPCPRFINSLDDRELVDKLTKDYNRNISLLKRLLDGKSQVVMKELKMIMKNYAQKHEFESAAKIRDSIASLENLLNKPMDSIDFINNPNLAHDLQVQGMKELVNILTPVHPVNVNSDLSRIEAYDISTYGGKNTSGSMVVLIEGEPANSEYRRFKISIKNRHADLPSMAEMLSRRFKHPEWEFPQLVIIDGGRTQLDAVKTALKDVFWQIPFVGLAKKFETIVVPQADGSYREVNASRHSQALKLMQLIRDEAHRFAGRYQRLLHSKSLLKR